MFEFLVTDHWKQAYPAAAAGVLVMRSVANVESPPALRARVQTIEAGIKTRYSGWGRGVLAELPEIRAYNAYYRGFKKTYHVLLQLESVVNKGRPIPHDPALLAAMFSAELKNLLLTAGHDLDAIRGPVRLNAAGGSERYETLAGEEKTLKTGDMFMADDLGVISSVLYGPDKRTRLSPETKNALFTVYAPAGIDRAAVIRHLEDLRDGVLLASPDAQVERLAAVPDKSGKPPGNDSLRRVYN